MTRKLLLDRIRVEEAGPSPVALADAIHSQLGFVVGAVPIEEIAHALDIVEIRCCELVGIEGGLVMPDDRSLGAIVVNAKAAPQRRRFTIAHELLHFLNLLHRPTELGRGFACTKTDMIAFSSSPLAGRSVHFRQEAEANRFAIEALAPDYRVRPFLSGAPDLSLILELAKDLSLSREAAARRYVQLMRTPTAVIFTENHVVRYWQTHPNFPQLAFGKRRAAPRMPFKAHDNGLSEREEGSPEVWLHRSRQTSLTVQTLWQRDGFAMTLLALVGT